jgi:hypothetical protein
MPESHALLMSLEEAWRAGPSEALEPACGGTAATEALHATDEQFAGRPGA